MAELEGTLEIQLEERPDGARYHYFLHSTRGRHALQFASPPKHLLTGARIRVRGVETGGTMLAVGGDGNSVTLVAPAPVPGAFGGQRTLVILVNFQDNPVEPYTLSDAQGVVFGTTSDFFLENSYQQAWLSGDVVGWYTIPVASTSCDGFQIQDYARQAATAAGVDLSSYTAFVYAFPTNSACRYSGMAQVGGPSVWINGAENMTLKVVGHELGHVYGLWHSHSQECGTEVIGSVISTAYPPPPGACYVYEYGDYFDIMGLGVSPSLPQAHFNAFQKERLGWLGGAIATVSASGTYALDTYESAFASNPKALKIPKSVDQQTGQMTWYYVEFRQALGFDGPLSTYGGNVVNGVLIRTGSEASPDTSDLLDLTPASFSWAGEDWKDPALVIGQSFFDPDAGLTIAPVLVDSTGAVVSVTLSPSACAHATPTVALSPAQSQSVTAGTAVTYEVSVTNNDSPTCAASSFNLQGTAPSGWSATLAASTLTLSPGAGASTTLTVTSAASAVAGFYSIGAAATNAAATAFSASTSATYAIGCTRASPTIALSPAQSQPVGAGATVTYTVSVTNNDSSSCTASAFSLQGAAPAGWGATFAAPTLTLSPGAGVSTTLTVTSAASAAAGFYSVGVTATNGAAPTFSASTSATYVIGCTRADPTVAVSPSQSQQVPAGTPVAYTVSITNNDAGGCTASSFGLQATIPTSWTGVLAASTLTLRPGASASTTLTVTSPASAAAGSYTLGVTVTNAASVTYAATSHATYMVAAVLNVTVSTDKSSYTRGQTVRLTAKATYGGSPVTNASVTVVTTKSNGSVTNQITTTDSSGTVVLTFKLRPKDPVGLYKVRADAAKTPLSGSATTSFTVQ